MKNRSYRNNNPGNLEFGPFTKKYGAVMEEGVSDPRFAKFETAGRGIGALAMLLSGPSYKDLTLTEMIERYAPSTENMTQSYINYVSTYTNLGKHVKISSLNAFQFLDLLRAITKREGYKDA